MLGDWYHWLTLNSDITRQGEFVSVFTTEEAHFLHNIFQTTREYRPSLNRQLGSFFLPVEVPSFDIGECSMLMHPRTHLPRREGEDWEESITKRVKVISLPAKFHYGSCCTYLFAGIICDMVYDPGRWRWRGYGQLHSYTAKLGRKLLNPRTQLQRPVAEKWAAEFPATYAPN
jgi:hypothetical protein